MLILLDLKQLGFLNFPSSVMNCANMAHGSVDWPSKDPKGKCTSPPTPTHHGAEDEEEETLEERGWSQTAETAS